MKKSSKKFRLTPKKYWSWIFVGALLISGVALAYQTMFAASVPNIAPLKGSYCYAYSMGKDRVACFAEVFAKAGIYETPANSNKGTWIDFWNKQTKISQKDCGNLGDSYCASFVSYMLRLGQGSMGVNDCSTSRMLATYSSKHTVKTFKPNVVTVGDVVYKSRPAGGVGAGHVGIVISRNYDTGAFTTAEANTQCTNKNGCVRTRLYNSDGSPANSDNASPPWAKILVW